MRCTRIALALAIGLFGSGTAQAHYHMLLPDKPSVKRGEAVTLAYQFGHPFEHQMFNAEPPRELVVLTPDGKLTDLTRSVEKIVVPGEDNKPVSAYRVTFTPDQRGDHIFMAVTPEFSLEGEPKKLVDTVKTVIHVQTQNGWDQKCAPRLMRSGDGEVQQFPLELTPLTRPYGLRAGTVFQVEVDGQRAGASQPTRPITVTTPVAQPTRFVRGPLPGVMVEVERYNPTPPKELPPDEHITRVVRTDRGGVATTTLPDPGWWALTAIQDGPAVRNRGTFWVHIDDKVPLGPAK